MKVLFLVASLTLSFVQKVPDIQVKSIWADKVKIDGKLNEWGSVLQAYNKDNKFWYTIANDDKYLYFAMKKDKNASKAYARGGVRFFVSDKSKINGDDKTASVTFPVAMQGNKNIPKEEWNDIEVLHIPEITDSLISIYNKQGIQVGWDLQNTADGPVYTYELAIPLKLINVRTPGQMLSYGVLLRGTRRIPLPPGRVSPLLNAIDLSPVPASRAVQEERADRDTWTEFQATYKLAVSPR